MSAMLSEADSRGRMGRPRARSLHIGLNTVDPKKYAGWSGPLQACEADARDLTALTRACGFQPTTLMTKEATAERVLAELSAAARELKAGDLFVLSYSGHGGQVKDLDRDERDGLDETWCLFDRQLIDDELYLALSRFSPGIRLLVLSDSCHSGTVTRAPNRSDQAAIQASAAGKRPRMMPREVEKQIRIDQKPLYDRLQQAVRAAAIEEGFLDPDAALGRVDWVRLPATGRLKPMRAQVILISGCQDEQVSMDGDVNGAFTEALLATWNRGAFAGDHVGFHGAIRDAMLPDQVPNYYPLGEAEAFGRQRPFTP